ncbi:MAG: hypothetical protein A2804_02915 [Candidatus Pacebacteria bacterium RIFCSPHIGHO2_01_FULL_46_10]|nr:MAG: hypothetical protein A2804_02915 [Candidatus Pacebacteria bacterium RIFCSPHIGHO2_01_FULL_46_10]
MVGQYSQQLPMPFRRYQIQPAFRAENTQRGRYREFLQCDADIFGVDSPYADAEVIALGLDVYRQLGFPEAKVLINDRSLLKDMPYEAIVAIDKLKKIGEDGVIADMEKKGITSAKAKEYLAFVHSLKPNETVKIIMDYLAACGFPKSWYAFEPTLARSFSYSTGPIWEIIIPEFSGSVLGGERFDNLIEKVSGQKIPGTGFGLGFDRTFEAAEQFNLLPQQKTQTRVLVTIFSPELQAVAQASAKQLRDAGINTELFPDPSAKLDKQLKYASKKGIAYVVIVGPDEKEKDVVTMKTMETGNQQTVPLSDIVAQLKTM